MNICEGQVQTTVAGQIFDISLRKKFFLSTFIISFLSVYNSFNVHAQELSLTLDKEIYYTGDTVRISYTLPDGSEACYKRGVRYNISVRLPHEYTLDTNVSAYYDVRSGTLEYTTDSFEPGGNTDLLIGSPAAVDYSVILTRDEHDKETQEIVKHFRVRQAKYDPISGALSIRGGNTFKPGDPIIIDINLPSSLKVLNPDRNGQLSVPNFHVELYYLNRQTHGGAIQPAQRVHNDMFLENGINNYSIASHQEEKILTRQSAWMMSNFRPGMYELRLYRKNGYTEYSGNYMMQYVVDSVCFEIVHENWPKSLKAESPDDLRVGEEIKVQVDSAAVPLADFASSSIKNDLEVYFYKVIDRAEYDDSGLLGYAVNNDTYFQYVAKAENHTDSLDFVFPPVDQPGKYAVMLQANYLFTPLYEDDYHQAFPGYILDSLMIDVGRGKKVALAYSDREKEMFKKMKKMSPSFEPPPPPGDPFLGTGNRSRFIPGEKISVEAYMPSGQPDATIIVALKHHDPDAGYSNGQPMGKQIKEWIIEVEKRKAWTIPGDLAVGSYDLVLKTKYIAQRDGKEHTGLAEVAGFQVVPELNTVKIDLKGKKNYYYNEKIMFDVQFPKPLKSDRFELRYNIIRKGGFLPGCAWVKDYDVGGGEIKNGTKNISFIAPPPGKYVLQVRGAQLDQHARFSQILLAEEDFTSDLPWQPDGLSFPSKKAEYMFKEDIEVTIHAHPDLGAAEIRNQGNKALDETGKYFLYLYRQGDVGYGGALRYPKAGGVSAYVAQAVNPKDTFILKKDRNSGWILPGAYEFRLFNKRSERSNSFLVSRLPFYVVDPQSPFPIEKGTPGVVLPSDLEPPVFYHGLKIGDFLGTDTCQNDSLEPVVEKMDLKFVRFEDGAYVDVKGAIDFGAGFYVQGKLEEEALQSSYVITLTTPEGDQQEVALFPLEDDPTVVRSDRVYLIWQPEEEVRE